MRTKQIVKGIKNSQKIRVILDGVGIYMTVKDTDHVFATTRHREAVISALNVIAKDNVTGFGSRFTTYDHAMVAKTVDCQVDLL